MATNPFVNNGQSDRNQRYRFAKGNPRPSRSIPAFASLTDEELAIAQTWHDEATAEHKSAVEMADRAAAYFETPEGQAERLAMRTEF